MFNHIIIGGTFDRLHKGHKKIIDTAFKKGKLVTIGITQKSLYKNKPLAQTIKNYEEREKSVLGYLKEKNWHSRVKFIPIVDFYGTTLIDKTIDAIVVSSVTKKTAQIINKKREEIGFPKLEIIIISNVLARDGGLITSERIRLGEINREGEIYDFLFKNNKQNKKELVLPENLREELRRPLGKVLKEIKKSTLQRSATSKYPMIISVGDIATKNLLQVGIDPDVKIIDFKTKREKISDSFFLQYTKQITDFKPYVNKPGTINLATAKVLKEKIAQAVFEKKKSWVIVKGEEDLLALPAILFAPLGSLVFYGQWNQGIIKILTTERKKKIMSNLLAKFHANYK